MSGPIAPATKRGRRGELGERHALHIVGRQFAGPHGFGDWLQFMARRGLSQNVGSFLGNGTVTVFSPLVTTTGNGTELGRTRGQADPDGAGPDDRARPHRQVIEHERPHADERGGGDDRRERVSPWLTSSCLLCGG